MKSGEILKFLKKRYYQEDSVAELAALYHRFPEWHYQGEAYRLVLLDQEPVDEAQAAFTHVSWAKSFAGVLAFLEHAQMHVVEGTQLRVYRGEITGLDLSNLVFNLQPGHELFPPLEAQQIRREEEVFNFTVEQLQEVTPEIVGQEIVPELVLMLNQLGELNPLTGNQRIILKWLEEQVQTTERWLIFTKAVDVSWYMQFSFLNQALQDLRQALFREQWAEFTDVKKRVEEGLTSSLHPFSRG